MKKPLRVKTPSEADYTEQANRLADRLHRFINAKETHKLTSDFDDVYAMLDNIRLRELQEDLEFAVFKRNRRNIEFLTNEILETI